MVVSVLHIFMFTNITYVLSSCKSQLSIETVLAVDDIKYLEIFGVESDLSIFFIIDTVI